MGLDYKCLFLIAAVQTFISLLFFRTRIWRNQARPRGVHLERPAQENLQAARAPRKARARVGNPSPRAEKIHQVNLRYVLYIGQSVCSIVKGKSRFS